MSGAKMSAGRVSSGCGRKVGGAPQPSAGQLALALVAAARIMGVAPDAVFAAGTPARRARILAGASLKAATGCVASELATTLHLSGPELAPSMLARAGVNTDMMLEVAEALNGGSLPAGRGVSVREARPLSAAAEAKSPARKTASKPQAAGADRNSGDRPGAASKAIIPSRSPRRARSEDPSAVQRLRPMTAARLRFARWFVEAGWEIEEVAHLFDAHEDALADALEFGVAA